LAIAMGIRDALRGGDRCQSLRSRDYRKRSEAANARQVWQAVYSLLSRHATANAKQSNISAFPWSQAKCWPLSDPTAQVNLLLSKYSQVSYTLPLVRPRCWGWFPGSSGTNLLTRSP